MWDITGDTFPKAPNPTYTLPDVTIPAELPPPNPFYEVGGSSVPAPVSTGEVNRNTDYSVSSFLQDASATGETLMKAWGFFNGLKTSAAQQKLQSRVVESEIEARQADMAVRSTQAMGNTELAKIQTAATIETARLQAQAAVARASQEVEQAKNGGVVYVAGQGGFSTTTLIGFAALGFAAWKIMGRGKK